jgi:hypothetical protein
MKQQSKTILPQQKNNSPDSIVNGAIEAHGGKLYDNADYPLCLEVRNIVFRITKRLMPIHLKFKRRFAD